MPRFSLTRILLTGVLWCVGAWLSLAIPYAALPALPYKWEGDAGSHLRTGARVTRVYETGSFFKTYDDKQSVRDAANVGRRCLILDYQIENDARSRSSYMRLENGGVMNLTEYSSLVPPDGSHISEQIPVQVRTADDDGPSLPWFRQADATLVYWQLEKEVVTIPLRVKAFENSIEIWPDSESWDSSVSPYPVVAEPLLRLHNDNGFNSTPIACEFPSRTFNSSPGRTLPLRLAISRILIPVTLFLHKYIFTIFGNIFSVIFEIISFFFAIVQFIAWLMTIYFVIVLLYWLLSGRPPFRAWTRSSPLTRFLYAWFGISTQPSNPSVWGSSGPLSEYEIDPPIGPQPLTGIASFFRSSSPLDDLLVTFECTRRFLQPLTFGRGGGTDQSNVIGVSGSIIKLDMSRRRSENNKASGLDLERAIGVETRETGNSEKSSP